MVLIIGGAYQGKLAYALERFNLTEDDIYRCGDENTNSPESKKIIYEIDKWIFAMIKANMIRADFDLEKAIMQFAGINQEAIVICNDISCGVVPVDPVMRQWRESVGRSLAIFSQKSDEVIRLFCGIPSRLK